MIKIHFHKSLHKLTEVNEHCLDVSDYTGMCSAINELFPRVRDYNKACFSGQINEAIVFINKNKRMIPAGKFLKNVFEDDEDEFWLVPAVSGKGKTGTAIIGIALIATALFLIPALAPGAAAATTAGSATAAEAATASAGTGLFAGFNGLTGFSAVLAKSILGTGINMVLSVLLSMLMPKIQQKENEGRKGNDYFGELGMSTSPNTPIPLNYGMIRWGGQMISASTFVVSGTTNKPSGKGRFFAHFGGTSGGFSAHDLITTSEPLGNWSQEYLYPATTSAGKEYNSVVETWLNEDNSTWDQETRGELYNYYTYFDEATSKLFVDLVDNGLMEHARRFLSVDGGLTWKKLTGFDAHPSVSRQPPWHSANYAHNGSGLWIAIGRKAATTYQTGSALAGEWSIRKTPYRVWKSSDGVTWSELSTNVISSVVDINYYESTSGHAQLEDWVSIKYWKEKSRWVAILHNRDDADQQNQIIYSSSPLVSWNAAQTPGMLFQDLFTGAGFFASIALVGIETREDISLNYHSYSGFKAPFWYSTDGITWNLNGFPEIQDEIGQTLITARGHRFARGKGIYLCACLTLFEPNGDFRISIFKSANGIDWSFVTFIGAREQYQAVVVNFDPVTDKFYLIVNQLSDSQFGALYSSADGITWTQSLSFNALWGSSKEIDFAQLVIRQTAWPVLVTTTNPYNEPGSDRDHSGGRAGRDTGASA